MVLPFSRQDISYKPALREGRPYGLGYAETTFGMSLCAGRARCLAHIPSISPDYASCSPATSAIRTNSDRVRASIFVIRLAR